ncbi:MAG: hypothetical protein Q4D41_08955, partial [Prevotellaceae bacterium]|nr:hypothetical protein [Prevotellaceae bacterium]
MNIFNHVVFKSLIVALSIFSVVACSSDDDNDPVDETATQTLFMFLPWSGSLYSYLVSNINAFETAIINNKGLDGRKLIVYISQTDATTSYLIDITYKDGKCVRDTLKTYLFSTTNHTTYSGIASILNDVIE